jgi:hypothetical protein
MLKGTFNARLRLLPAACILALLFSSVASAAAHTIDLSLNVFPATHTWELVAKADAGTSGISAVTALIRNINGGVQNEGPRGTVNGSDPAGFGLFFDNPEPPNPPTPAHREITIAQLPIDPVPSGNEQTVFYGVGTIANGNPPPGPNSLGPAFTSLTNPQDIPWATGDPFGSAAWSTAARLASGTYPIGVVLPAFVPGSTGNVFTSVPTLSTDLGDQEEAAITSIVRIAFSADYNHNGVVDAADYVLWRKQSGLPAVPPGSGADGNFDGTVDQLDYDLWRAHFGNAFGAGSGGGLSTSSVPEPLTGALVAVGSLLAMFNCRGQRRGVVNS